MNVKELREALVEVPDDVLVCGKDHYGEPLDVDWAGVEKMHPYMIEKPFNAFVIDMEYSGKEPE